MYQVDENGQIKGTAMELPGGKTIKFSPDEMNDIINSGMNDAYQQVFSKDNWNSETNESKYLPQNLEDPIRLEKKMSFTSSKWATEIGRTGIELLYADGKTTSENFNLFNISLDALKDKNLTIGSGNFTSNDREFMSLLNAYGEMKDPNSTHYNAQAASHPTFYTFFKSLTQANKESIFSTGLIPEDMPFYGIFDKAGFFTSN